MNWKFVLNILLLMIAFNCTKMQTIERHLDSTSYFYACGPVLGFKDWALNCDRSFPSENLEVMKDYESWLKDQSPYADELEQVCKSDRYNYKRMQEHFVKEDKELNQMLLKNPSEFLEICKRSKKSLREYPKDASKKMLWELVH